MSDTPKSSWGRSLKSLAKTARERAAEVVKELEEAKQKIEESSVLEKTVDAFGDIFNGIEKFEEKHLGEFKEHIKEKVGEGLGRILEEGDRRIFDFKTRLEDHILFTDYLGVRPMTSKELFGLPAAPASEEPKTAPKVPGSGVKK